MRTHLVSTLAALLCCTAAHAQVASPERSAKDGTVTSRTPAVSISVPAAARYLGADRWTLYDVADCEVHVFVESDAQRNVQRVYWIQFEAYLPDKPELRYNYDRDALTRVDGLAIHHRERFGPGVQKARAGSDLEHVDAIIAAAGYRMPKEIVNSRLVYLPDDTRRMEVMVIYIEDMAVTGKTSTDFMAEGRVTEAWTPVGEQVLERAKARIKIRSAVP